VVPPPTATATKDAAETGSKRKKRSGGSSGKRGGGKRKPGKSSSELAARVKEYWQLLDCVETATLDAAVCHLQSLLFPCVHDRTVLVA
jgi:hypothetical protein